MRFLSLWHRLFEYGQPKGYCVLCHDSATIGFCESCFVDISEQLTQGNDCCPLCFHYSFNGVPCGQCQKKPPQFERLWASVYYDAPISKMIHQFKHQADLSILQALVMLMQKNPPTWLAMESIDWVLPMPLSKERRIYRGFNQSEELAKKLAKGYGWRVLPAKCVYRIDKTPQSTLKSSERQQNVKNVFQIKNTNIQDCNILLIDDVVTTGATLNELARTLKKSGVSKVFCWSLARSQMKR